MSAQMNAAALGAVLAMCGALVSAAGAQSTTATITPSLSPDRLGARAALTYTIHFAGGEQGVPEPVRRTVLRFPAGLALDLPALRSCSAEHLYARGPQGCPARSRLGGGHGVAEVRAGAEILTENLTLRVFLGTPRNLQPTVAILVQGYTPFDRRVVLTGTPLAAASPYEEGLAMTLPPIPTLPLEPPASIASFTLTIGTPHGGRNETNTVKVPSICPRGGFPFAAELTYSDGTSGSAFATVPCPS